MRANGPMPHGPRQLVRGALRGLSGGYAGGLVALELMRHTPAAAWPPFALATILGLALYGALAPLSVIVGERRR
jgi:hypothetical protein